MPDLYWIFICLVVFVVGFWVGRRLGRHEGIKVGLEQAPLEMKRRSLENGSCPICGITKNFQDNAGKL